MNIEDVDIYKDYIRLNEEGTIADILNKDYKNEYNYSFVPNIIKYKDTNISNQDIRTTPNNIKKSNFFNSLFNKIDENLSKIERSYEDYKKFGKAFLDEYKEDLNKKLEKVSEKFNQLYHLDDSKYTFKIDLDSVYIEFMIFRSKKALSLDHQSTGFRWFFNLFFNLLSSTEFTAGDIIIMDEPATNLHVKGQRELRTFLKDFAIQNDITIIIATHSPFLIDLDYLDELRIVLNKENITFIENSFVAVDLGIPDTLLPIRESLTIENHILVNPENDVIFIEGITDYLYLTTFKKLLGKNNLIFLPINGVGKSDQERRKIIEQLIKMRKDPIILADGDIAGKKLKELNKELKSNLEIITLNEINPQFKEIENLFEKEDKEKFKLDRKYASNATIFKNKIIYKKDVVSEKTKNNFIQLFDKLEELIN